MSRFKIYRNEMKCIICKEKAEGRFTTDLDIEGIGFCKKHQELIKSATLFDALGLHDIATSIILTEQKKYNAKRRADQKKADKNITKGNELGRKVARIRTTRRALPKDGTKGSLRKRG